MATSGTYGTTVFNTRKVVDHAYRGCRVPPQTVTGEMIQTALDQLFLMLSEWANVGTPLWCIQRYVLGLYEGIIQVPFPAGVVDTLNVNLRDVNRLTGTASASSGVAANAFDDDFDTECNLAGVGAQNLQLLLDSANTITVVGILPGNTATWNFQLQWSEDGVTWNTFYTNAAYSAVDLVWLWIDIEGLPAVQYYRLLTAAAQVIDIREMVWANNAREINMARINKDDYFYLPDKNIKGRPVQFWEDRQRTGPILNVWPAPDMASRYRQITALAHRHIMDVGTLQQEIEVPQRWYNAVVWSLAEILSIITPEVKPPMIPICAQMADRSRRLAWGEERDVAPINIDVDISPYTR